MKQIEMLVSSASFIRMPQKARLTLLRNLLPIRKSWQAARTIEVPLRLVTRAPRQ